jgi:hypothetical protein
MTGILASPAIPGLSWGVLGQIGLLWSSQTRQHGLGIPRTDINRLKLGSVVCGTFCYILGCPRTDRTAQTWVLWYVGPCGNHVGTTGNTFLREVLQCLPSSVRISSVQPLAPAALLNLLN